MAITNIKNNGTILSPIISATVDNINFTNIPDGNKGTNGSTFWNNSSNANVWKDNGDGSQWRPSVNAVDINWNAADLQSAVSQASTNTSEDLSITGINTTGDLIKVVAEQQAQIKSLSLLVKALYESIVVDGSETTPTDTQQPAEETGEPIDASQNP